MNAVDLSVVICAHNPRADYLARVLDALRAQSLPREGWELLLIDNASSEALSDRYDLSWHPAGRHIREDELGLTPARLRGIAEAKGDILVFVDDDNVLAADYLAKARRIANEYPQLGSWGSGAIDGEYEVTPPSWLLPHIRRLGVRRIETERWSNSTGDWITLPIGAGLCVRREVAECYAQEIEEDGSRRLLDLRGTELGGGGDTDIVLVSSRFKKGWGVFPCLQLTHLLPATRMTLPYMLRLIEQRATTDILLQNKLGQNLAPYRQNAIKTLVKCLMVALKSNAIDGRMLLARQRGIKKALDMIETDGPLWRLGEIGPSAESNRRPNAGHRISFL